MNSNGMKEHLQNFIELTKSLVAKLTELIKRVEKHIRDYRIAKTTGVSVAAVGTSMMVGGWIIGLVTAVPTFGLSLTVPAIMTVAGISTTIAGGLTTAGTEIADGIISKDVLNELTNIQSKQAAAVKDIQEILQLIQYYVSQCKIAEDDINAHSTGEIFSGSARMAGASTAVFSIVGLIDDATIAGFGVVFTAYDIVKLVKAYNDPNLLLNELKRYKRLCSIDIDKCEKLLLIFK